MPVMKTIREAAIETGLTYNCLRQWCLTGAICYVRAGSKILINMEKLAAYLNGELQNVEDGEKDG